MKNGGLAISKDEVYIGPEHAGELFGWVNTSQNAVYRSVVLSYAQIGEDGARMSLMGPSSGEQAEPIDEGFHNALSLELTESRRNGHNGRPSGAVMDSVIQTCSPNKSNLL